MRLALSGPTSGINVAAVVAAECGLVEEEITLLSDGTGPSTVFCVRCRTINANFQPIGSEVECQGCTTVLSISNHFSRRIAAYLGYSANAEAVAYCDRAA